MISCAKRDMKEVMVMRDVKEGREEKIYYCILRGSDVSVCARCQLLRERSFWFTASSLAIAP